jgi:pimeloyl-ACP methyl ester carboxylesterase
LEDKRCPDLQKILKTDALSLPIDVEAELPVLIVWGDNDQILPAERIGVLKQQFGKAECRIIPQCGHVPHEENPKLTNSILKQFMLSVLEV